MNEEKNVNYGEIKEKIKDLQLTVLVNFFECAMYQKYGAGWKEKTIKKAKDKIRKNDHGNSYKTLVTFYDNNGGFEKTNLEISVTVALIEHDFLQACCRYKNLPNEILRSKVDKLREDRNKEAHSPLERDDYKKCADTLNNLEEFIDFLDEHSWKFEASKNFMKYLRECGHDIDKEITFLEKARNRLLNYKAVLKNISKSKEINDYKTVKVVFVDEKQKSLDGISCTIISNLTHIERGRFDEVKRFSILLEPGEYSIVCNSVPEGYKEFALKQLRIEATDEADVDKIITVLKKDKKYGEGEVSLDAEKNQPIQESEEETKSSILDDIDDSEVDVEQSEETERLFEKGCEYYYKSEIQSRYSKALNFFKQAADCGHIEANMYLAKMYFEGNGINRDVNKACDYLKKVAKYGNVEAQYYLGTIFEEGSDEESGVKRNYDQALFWYKKAAEQNHIDAMFKLGQMYLSGKAEKTDKEKGYTLIAESAEKGNAEAQCFLGKAYEMGLLKKNFAKALDWYKLAAEQNNTEAICRLGKIYFYGRGIAKDEKQAFDYFQKSAEKGYAEAQYFLGLIYQTGYAGFDVNLEKALQCYEKAAEQNNVDALIKLGDMYYEAKGVARDFAKALACYEKAAEQGDVDALNKLGDMYYEGKEVEQDKKKAVELYEQAAEGGNAIAMCNLGYMYGKGEGVEQDKKKAVELYEKAAEQGYARAMCNLGYMYDEGEGVEQDKKKAVELYEKAAEQGNERAMCNLGYMYDEGDGVEQDKKKAVELYEKAAEQGSVDAMYNLARMYYEGEGVEVDKKKAAELCEKAAEQGSVGAMYNLARMYYEGEGVERDYGRAVTCYEKAALQGNTDAMCSLGVMYIIGEGVAQDKKKAAELFERAAEQGEVYAIVNLGLMYDIGDGVEVDKEKAVELYEKAAEQGNVNAMYNLGVMYSKGEGVEQDKKKAIELYEKAAEQGDVDAMCNLGVMYSKGEGVELDYKKAVDLYKKAVARGSEKAKMRLQKLQEKIDTEESNGERPDYFYPGALDNNPKAQYQMGQSYEKGYGVERNLKEAARYYRLAIQNDCQEAKTALVNLLKQYPNLADAENPICLMDYLSSSKLYNDANYQYKIALCYEHGVDCKQNIQEAYSWYKKAANQGYQLAQDACDRLEQSYPELAPKKTTGFWDKLFG